MAKFTDGSGVSRLWTRIQTLISNAISAIRFHGDAFYSTDGSNLDSITQDCNSLTANGLYYYTSNGPSIAIGATTNDGSVFVQGYNDNWVSQIAQDYRTGNLFIRSRNSGTWTEWRPVPKSSDIPDVSTKMNVDGSNSSDNGIRFNSRISIGTTTTTVMAAASGSVASGYSWRGYGDIPGTIRATGIGSHAQGYVEDGQGDNFSFCGKIEASGSGSHAEGCSPKGSSSTYYGIIASGNGSHAEGYGTVVASGNGSHAEGTGTAASGNYSHAEGRDNRADGNYSHAGGYNSAAEAQGSFVHASKGIARNTQQVLFGNLTTQENSPRYSSLTYNSTVQTMNKSIFSIENESIGHSSNSYGDPPHNSTGQSLTKLSTNTLLDIDNYGNLFLTGHIYKARGKLIGKLVADGRNITLDPGAIYVLYIAGWITSTNNFRGINAYVVAAGLGANSTALAAPKIASIGTTGTVCCKLSSTYSGSSSPYGSVLGIGCCTTAITIRYTLQKVSGSTSDFN